MDFRFIFRVIIFSALLGIVYLATVLLPISTRMTSTIDLWGRDLSNRVRVGLQPVPDEIGQLVIVALDDASLRLSGQRYPFPRWLHAQAIDGMMAVRPLSVAYDFVFGGAGYTAEEDAAFIESLARARGIVLASYVDDKLNEQGPGKAFLQGGAVKGALNKWTIGGVARTTLPFYIDPNTQAKQWSWEFTALFQAGLVKPEDVTFHRNLFRFGDTEHPKWAVPVRPVDHQFHINFLAKPEAFEHISFWRFLKRDLEKDDYSDKIFLVGNTSKLSHDKHPTPLGRMDGIYMNANAVLTLLSQRFVYTAPAVWELLLLLIALVVVVGTGLTNRIVAMTVSAFSFAVLFSGLAFWALWHDIQFDLYYEAAFLIVTWFCLAVYRQITMAVENINLQKEAIHDPLTGFFTRRYLSVRLKYDLERLGKPSFAAKRKGNPGEFALAMVDLDNFKLVNDTFGHPEGDRTLKTVAEVIRKFVRREDIVCRFGGDEFCIIMAGTNAEGGAALLERVREGIINDDRLSYRTGGNVKTIRVTASMGVAGAKWTPDLTSDMLIKIADKALYEAKKGGRNRIVIADGKHIEKAQAESKTKDAPSPEAQAG